MRRFYPWTGNHYADGLRDGRKVLIVGESHYEDDGTPEFTRKTIATLGIKDPYRFFEAIRLTARGLDETPGPADFWHRVAFANAVQEGMPDKTVRPTKEQMVAGMADLREIVLELKPELVLCYSGFAWGHIDHLYHGERGSAGWAAAPGVDAMWWFKQPTGSPLLAVRINHPARLNVLRQVWNVWIEQAWTYLRDRIDP